MSKPLTDIVLGRPVKMRSGELPAEKVAELNAALKKLQAQRSQNTADYTCRPAQSNYQRPPTFYQLHYQQ